MPAYKNKFASPKYVEQTIVDENGATIGTLRIKPSTVLWKPSNVRQYYAISMAKFSDWITDPQTKARRTKQ